MSAVLKLLARNSKVAKPILEPVLNNTTELNQLRKEIVQLRTGYWLRKAMGYSNVYNAAKGEARELVQKWKNPGEFTGRDVAVGAVWFVHIFGCFCIGEMWGRGSVIGYTPGQLPAHH
jgi:hypothetical protein